jgi:hypothetical protein
MTEREMDVLEQDVLAWEALERTVGQDPEDVRLPDDLSARIERMVDENGEELEEAIIGWELVDRPQECDDSGGTAGA